MTTIEIGADAEERAACHLETQGYRIVERNYRCKAGELDVVAYDGATLVFVEVRSRASDEFGHAAEMVTPRKQRQVARVAEMYLLERRPRYADARFDVVAITGGDIVLLRDAFRSSR